MGNKVLASARSQRTKENMEEVRLTGEDNGGGGEGTVGRNGGDLTTLNGIRSIFNFLPWA